VKNRFTMKAMKGLKRAKAKSKAKSIHRRVAEDAEKGKTRAKTLFSQRTQRAQRKSKSKAFDHGEQGGSGKSQNRKAINHGDHGVHREDQIRRNLKQSQKRKTSTMGYEGAWGKDRT